MGVFNKAITELGITALYEVKDRINDVIQEELGISDVVDKGTDNLCKTISDKIKTAEWEKVENGLKYAVLSFKYNFNGYLINVGVYCFNFFNRKIREELRDKYPDEFFEDARSSYGKANLPFSKHTTKLNSLTTNLMMISGTIDKDRLYYCIRHELRHIYEQIMNGGMSFSNFKDNALYMKASDMFNRNPEGSIEKNIGLLGYMSFDYERHAFVEEYFGKLKLYVEKFANGSDNSDTIYHYLDNDNPVLDKIVRMRYTLTKLYNRDTDYVLAANKMLNDTGFTLEKFIQRAEDSIKDLSLRYGRCIVKAKNDYPPLFKDRRYSDLSYIQNKHRPHPEYYI